MPPSAHIEHVPVIGRPSRQAEERATLVFDCASGRKIGHSPHVRVEQTDVSVADDGVITTTLTIRPLKART